MEVGHPLESLQDNFRTNPPAPRRGAFTGAGTGSRGQGQGHGGPLGQGWR